MEARRARKTVTYHDDEEDDDFGVSAVDQLPKVPLPQRPVVESIMAIREPEDGTDPSLPIETQLSFYVKYKGFNFGTSEWADGEELIEAEPKNRGKLRRFADKWKEEMGDMKEPPAGVPLYPTDFAKVDFLIGFGQPEGAKSSMYLTKWRGLGGADATWETEASLKEAAGGPGALAKFQASGNPTPSPLWQAYSRAPPSNEKGKRTHIRIYVPKPSEAVPEEEAAAGQDTLPESRARTGMSSRNRFGVWGEEVEEEDEGPRVSDDNPLKQALLDSMDVLGVSFDHMAFKVDMSEAELRAWLFEEGLLADRQELLLRAWIMDRLTEGWEDRKAELLRTPANLRETYGPARLTVRAELGLPYADLPLPSGSRVVGEELIDKAGDVGSKGGLPAGIINLASGCDEDGTGGHMENYAAVPLQALGALMEGLGADNGLPLNSFMQQLAAVGAMTEVDRKDAVLSSSRPVRGRTVDSPAPVLVPVLAQPGAVAVPAGVHEYSGAHVTVAAPEKTSELQPGVRVPVLPTSVLTAPELMPCVNSHSVCVAGMWLPRGLTGATFPHALASARQEVGVPATAPDTALDALLWAQYEALQAGTTDPSLWAQGVDPVAYSQGKVALAGPLPNAVQLDAAAQLAAHDQQRRDQRRAEAGKPTRVLLGQMEARMPPPTVYGPPGTAPDRDNRPRGGSRGGITRRVVLQDDDADADVRYSSSDSDSDFEVSNKKKKSASAASRAEPQLVQVPDGQHNDILNYSNGAAESWVAAGPRHVLIPDAMVAGLPHRTVTLANGAGQFAVVLAHPAPASKPAVLFYLPMLSDAEVITIQQQANAAQAQAAAAAHAAAAQAEAGPE